MDILNKHYSNRKRYKLSYGHVSQRYLNKDTEQYFFDKVVEIIDFIDNIEYGRKDPSLVYLVNFGSKIFVTESYIDLQSFIIQFIGADTNLCLYEFNNYKDAFLLAKDLTESEDFTSWTFDESVELN